MKNDEAKIHSGFLRQRRNLFIISIGLLLFQAFKLEFKIINFFGNIFDVKRPELIPAFLWIAWGYFIVRYYQYFHDMHRGVKEKIGEYSTVLLSKTRIRIAKWKIIKELGLKRLKYKIRNASIQEHISQKWLDCSTVTFQAIITTKEKDKITNKTTGFQKDVEILWKGFLFVRLQSFLHVCFRTSFITEYYLPFVVATFPVLWLLFAKHF